MTTLDRRSFLAGSVALAGAALLPGRTARASVADLDFASALEAARAIRAGQVSAVELTQRMLDRISRLNPKLNAIVVVTAAAALERARAADEARARRESWGPFHGVPITIKDTFEVAGVTTTAGSRSLRHHVPLRDAAVVARLKGAGAIILGKTNVPLFAADWQSFNAVYGQTNNPWDVTRTPGGSTGGRAAALAAGLSYLEPGSDLGGSVRIPAHFCGIYGHKPTLDIVPMRGHIPPPPGISAAPPSTLPVCGPLARSAADLRAALEVMGGLDGDEARAWRWSLPPARGARLGDYRIGYVLDDPRGPVSPEVGDVLAAFVGADADDLAFVANATGGVNAVLRSLRLSDGDELLTTDHAYQACRNTLDYVAERTGARVVVAAIPFPVASPRAIIDAVLAKATPRTRLALLDHITSPTGLILPIERLVAELAGRGIETLVDGAHAPGMVPLDLRALGAAYYSGNCHKWLCTPKGSAFLWVRRDRQADVHPLTISHGAKGERPGRSRFRLEFDWTGTQDPTAWLTVPMAIDYLGGLVPGGWPALMARNRALALEARRLICAAIGIPPACPDAMIGSLASMILPDSVTTDARWRVRDPIQGRLFDAWGIEVPIMRWPAPPRRLIRISAQLYNSADQYARLAEALRKELAAERG